MDKKSKKPAARVLALVGLAIAAVVVLYFANDTVHSKIDKLLGRDPASRVETGVRGTVDSVKSIFD